MTDFATKKANKVPPLPSSFSLISTLGVVALVSGFLLVLVYEYTKPIIAKNVALATQRAIFKVLPKATSYLTFMLKQDALKLADDSSKGELLYAGYDKENKFIGMALITSEQGYQNMVKLLYGYHPLTGCISGFDVLKSTETPGFGTKITTDEAFLANFNCLDGQVNKEQNRLINAIKTVRYGTKSHPWEIDAISGATITSNAVGRMLNKSGQKLHPVIAKNMALLTVAKQSDRGHHDAPD